MIALILYFTISLTSATVWTILGALLLLPSYTEIKIPMIPAIDKESVGNLAAVVGCVLLGAGRKQFFRTNWAIVALAIVYVTSPVITSVLNNDAIVAGFRDAFLDGHRALPWFLDCPQA